MTADVLSASEVKNLATAARASHQVSSWLDWWLTIVNAHTSSSSQEYQLRI